MYVSKSLAWDRALARPGYGLQAAVRAALVTAAADGMSRSFNRDFPSQSQDSGGKSLLILNLRQERAS